MWWCSVGSVAVAAVDVLLVRLRRVMHARLRRVVRHLQLHRSVERVAEVVGAGRRRSCSRASTPCA